MTTKPKRPGDLRVVEPAPIESRCLAPDRTLILTCTRPRGHDGDHSVRYAWGQAQ